MNTPKKILFIQHASGLGGSCMSLFYTMQNLDRLRFEPILALANDSKVVIDFYKATGYSPIACPGITFWGHTTGSSFSLCRLSCWMNIYHTLKSWNKGMRTTIDLVKTINPSIVHLNSVVLSISALALKKNNIPFVWHVREHPPKTIFGFRTYLISKMLMKLPSELIFISNADKQAWINGQSGQVIHNFVNFSEFDRNRNGFETRKTNNIPINAPMILYLGGLRTIKGIFTLIKALHILKKRLHGFYCLMPGSTYNPPDGLVSKMARRILPIFGSGTVGQRAMRLIKNLDLQ
jgi:glycosyltransferase involved in cell wall biosynthesis